MRGGDSRRSAAARGGRRAMDSDRPSPSHAARPTPAAGHGPGSESLGLASGQPRPRPRPRPQAQTPGQPGPGREQPPAGLSRASVSSSSCSAKVTDPSHGARALLPGPGPAVRWMPTFPPTGTRGRLGGRLPAALGNRAAGGVVGETAYARGEQRGGGGMEWGAPGFINRL